jgi:hypothetical protein
LSIKQKDWQGKVWQQWKQEFYFSNKSRNPEVVIPNGVLCREESDVAGRVLAAGKKQIPRAGVRLCR